MLTIKPDDKRFFVADVLQTVAQKYELIVCDDISIMKVITVVKGNMNFGVFCPKLFNPCSK